MTDKAPHENPLVPNKKLRQMYVAMAEARVLDEHIATAQKNIKPARRLESTRGQEACRVSTSVDLTQGDLVSDAHPGVIMDLLLGAKADSLLKRFASLTSDKSGKQPALTPDTRQLPWIEDLADRLRLAMGAALSLKTHKTSNIVVAYARHRETSGGVWRKVLSLAASLDLPIVFVVLPEVNGSKKSDGSRNIRDKARAAGLPGIPVDASDCVALYRVMQESMGRTRTGGGPVLIECIPYRVEGKGGKTAADPVAQMKGLLLDKKIATEAWLNETADALRTRLAQSKR